MLAMNPEGAVIGWLNQRVPAQSDHFTMFVMERGSDWTTFMSDDALDLNAQTHAMRLRIERVGLCQVLDEQMLEAIGLDPRQLDRSSTDIAQMARILAARGLLPTRALILAEAPEHTRIEIHQDAQAWARVLRIGAAVLVPSEADLERLFDAPDFIALDEDDYEPGDLDDLLKGARRPVSGPPSGASGMVRAHWQAGLTVMRPSHISTVTIC